MKAMLLPAGQVGESAERRDASDIHRERPPVGVVRVLVPAPGLGLGLGKRQNQRQLQKTTPQISQS